MNHQTIYALMALAGFVTAFVGAGLVLRWAIHRDVLDHPNERSSHTMPTPKGGGVAIVLVVLVGQALVGYLLGASWPLAVVIGASAIALISFIDDLHEVPGAVRLGVHVLAAALTLYSCGYWHVVKLPLLPEFSTGILGPIIAVIWIVGLTNAFNFMDGIDGIAASQAVMAGFGWIAIGVFEGIDLTIASGILISTAALGFVVHNWAPARIFMGDVGSAFLGYTFAVLPLMASQIRPNNHRFAAYGVLLVWPFVFDSGLTVLRRVWRRENIFVAHRTHLYQKLVIAGMSHATVTALYAALALLGALLVLVWLRGYAWAELFISFALLLACTAITAFTIRHERRHAANIPVS